MEKQEQTDNSAAAHASQRKDYYEKMARMADAVFLTSILTGVWLLNVLITMKYGWLLVVGLLLLMAVGQYQDRS